jgi:hypothetical protein
VSVVSVASALGRSQHGRACCWDPTVCKVRGPAGRMSPLHALFLVWVHSNVFHSDGFLRDNVQLHDRIM